MARGYGQRARCRRCIERFVRQLIVADKAVALYPLVERRFRAKLRATAVDVLDEALRETTEIRLAVTRDGFVYEGAPGLPGPPHVRDVRPRVLQPHARRRPLSRRSDAQRISSRFLTVLNIPPTSSRRPADSKRRLWEQNVGTISGRPRRRSPWSTPMRPPSSTSPRRNSPPTRSTRWSHPRGVDRLGDQITIARFMCDPVRRAQIPDGRRSSPVAPPASSE